MRCDLTMIGESLTDGPRQLPLLLFGDAGIANYNNGVVSLNRNSSFGVFTHELFHHFGFMDEYALNPGRARQLCQPGKLGENLQVVSRTQWQQLGIPQSRRVATCEHSEFVAFKAVNGLTNMGYMDQPMPSKYLRLARKRLEKARGLANVQYAIALAYHDKGDLSGYRLWLQRSANDGYPVAEQIMRSQFAFLIKSA